MRRYHASPSPDEQAEACLFQSYTRVEMGDLEDDQEDSQSVKKPKTRCGDSTWRKLSEVDSSSTEAGVMVG